MVYTGAYVNADVIFSSTSARRPSPPTGPNMQNIRGLRNELRQPTRRVPLSK